MNLPATVGKNWQWRLTDGEPNDDLMARLQEMTEIYGRAKPRSPDS